MDNSKLIFIKQCNNCKFYDMDKYCKKIKAKKNSNEYCEEYDRDYTPSEEKMTKCTLGEFLAANNMIREELYNDGD